MTSTWWDILRSHASGMSQVLDVERQKRAFHQELKRLSSLGDYLIEDIGLDPKAVRLGLEDMEGDCFSGSEFGVCNDHQATAVLIIDRT